MSFSITDIACCVEYFYAKEDCRDELAQALLKLVEPTRAEPGCLQYDLLQDKNDPNLIIMIVKFSNQNLMQQHENQSYIKSFIENEMKQYCEKFICHDANEISK